MKESIDDKLDRVADALAQASRVLFVTGAGISAASGIPTYRGIGGLYNDADTPEGIPIEEALSGEMLRREPAVTWRYIHQIERASRGASYNRAHAFCAAMESRLPHVCVLTQNVDGFHREAGSENVIDIHGDVHDVFCTTCSYRTRLDDYTSLAPLPLCPECNHPLRPDVVLFGELLPVGKVEHMSRELEAGFDLVFSIGTTSVFPYIMQPVIEAARRGDLTVEINPGSTTVSSEVHVRLQTGAVEAVDGLIERMEAS